MKKLKAMALACLLFTGAFAQDDIDLDITADDLFGDEPAAAPASSGSGYTGTGNSTGSGFDDTAIDDLFGKFEDQPAKVEDDKPARVLPPFHGDYKVLISRPIYAVYEAETKTKWVSATAEAYTHYKVASFPRTQVFTMDQVDNVLPNSRDYGRRFNRAHFIAAAKKLGATHLIYQEYQPHKNGKEARFSMELYWLDEGATVIKATQDVQFGAFERGLDLCIEKIADAMDKDAKKTAAMSQPFLGRDVKLLETFGNILAGEGSFTKESAAAAYNAADRHIQRNKGNLAIQYAAAMLAGRADSYDKAIEHINIVIGKSGDYPALLIYLAGFLRGAERYAEAVKAAETASRTQALKRPASIELAMIFQAQGDLGRARSEYDAVMQSGEADGRIFFQLALLSIQSGNISESETYLNRASESGFSLDESEYYELGLAYGGVDGYSDKALELLKRSLGVKQNNESAWLAIADVYKRTGNAAQEADTYVNLFKINMSAHSSKLRLAGEIYETLGMIDKAKDAYTLFLERKFANADVSMNLARIYFNEKNCSRLENILRGYDTIPEATQMLEECGIKVRKVKGNVEKKKLSPLMLTLRITSGVFAVGGIAAGAVIDQVIITDLVDKYNDYSELSGAPKGTPAEDYEEVKKMHNQIKDNMTMRNLMYILGAVGVSGFAVTYFF